MSDKEEYGLEDICTSLDAIEVQLKRLVSIIKIEAKARIWSPTVITEIDQI